MKHISKPSRYYGVEISPHRGRPGKPSLKIALTFPEVYELGMSHYGFLLLYHLLKNRDSYLVDRVFAPWSDMEEKLHGAGEKLKSFEYAIPLSDFDVVGFSLAYELSLTNVLTILKLSDIPVWARDRRENAPIIICGGALVANPEPFADFFDAVFVGEGEEAITELMGILEEGKRKGSSRYELIRSLAEVEGIYLPSLYTPVYDNSGILTGYESTGGEPGTTRRRIVRDIGAIDLPRSHIFPSMRLVHDRISIEITRGCTRGCRFCQAGYYYRPFRERSAGSILEYLKDAVLTSGYDEVGFLSLSSSDYSCIDELVKRSMDILESEKISVSLPSLRINTVSEDLVKELKRVRKGGFTLAPEAGREGLRRKINKDITDAEIFETISWIFQNGWNSVKLYFMIGLPGETDEDIYAISDLGEQAVKIARKYGRNTNVTISLSTFVPKPHTPFQWAAQISREEMERRIKILKDRFRGNKKVTLKWHNPHMSWLEGIISRGDRRVAHIIEHAHGIGARLDAWSDCFDVGLWEKSVSAVNIDPHVYTGNRQLEQFLPWDIIDTGIEKKFLEREWRKSLSDTTTGDCRIIGCNGCGTCRVGEITNRFSPPLHFSQHAQEAARKTDGSQSEKYIVVHKKIGRASYQSALEIQSLISRTLRASGLPLKYSEGFNPKPKISFPSALPVGVSSCAEFFILTLRQKMSPESILTSLKPFLPKELSPITVISAEGGLPPIIREERFRISPLDDSLPLPVKTPADAEKNAGVKGVMKRGKNMYLTISTASDESAVKKIVKGIFGCTLSDLDIKITKTSSTLFFIRENEKRQIYPHKQQKL